MFVHTRRLGGVGACIRDASAGLGRAYATPRRGWGGGVGACVRGQGRRATPRRWQPTRWVSTMPVASISANIVVGPTKPNPRFFSAFDSASDSGEVVGTRPWSGAGVGSPARRTRRTPPARRRRAARSVAAGVASGPTRPWRGCGRCPASSISALQVGVGHRGHPVDVEAVEDLAVALALVQDRQPGQTGLGALEAEPLEQRRLPVDRDTPLGVVVVAQHSGDAAPRAPGDAVLADDRRQPGHGHPRWTIRAFGSTGRRDRRHQVGRRQREPVLARRRVVDQRLPLARGTRRPRRGRGR